MPPGTTINSSAPPGAVPLGTIRDDLARRATAAASRLARAASELDDLWRFEVECGRTRAELAAIMEDGRAWRAERDAEVAAEVAGAW